MHTYRLLFGTRLRIVTWLLLQSTFAGLALAHSSNDAETLLRETIGQYEADHDVSKARAGFTKVIELAPNLIRAHERLFYLATAEKQWVEAASIAEKIILLSDNSGDARQLKEHLKTIQALQKYGSARADFCTGPDFTTPTPKGIQHPEYTAIALRTRLQGSTHLWLEVDERGTTRNIKIIKRLGGGLDESAVDAMRRTKFVPGARNGLPVMCGQILEIGFSLP